MADSWTQAEGGREFFVDVEVYLSSKNTTALKKPAAQRKKADKRDSRGLSILTPDESQKKIKEKTSWLNLSRGNTVEWRPATCRLIEENENCTLNVYLNETTLFQTIFVHSLKYTDIRTADRSLFPKENVIGIHCQLSQRWTSTSTTEPLYFSLPSSDALQTWLALLRSYAVPEIYGQWSHTDGGLYRVWRQVDVTCSQGRNIVVDGSRALAGTLTDAPRATREGASESDAVSDADLYCDIYVNSTLCGRTVVKRSLGAPDWHEQFIFADLPKLEQLTLLIYQEKKPPSRPAVVGSVHVALANFRRGELVEGWFPVLSNSATVAAVQVGQVRLKLKVDEVVILPSVAYDRALDVLDSRNYLDWMSDLEHKLKVKHLIHPLTAVAAAQDKLLKHILDIADREINGTPNSHNTLFRGNTPLTKTAELFMAWYGKQFLEQSLGNNIRRICTEAIAIEVDPARNTSAREAERDVERLRYWCSEVWKGIFEARASCPEEFRSLFRHVRELVAQRYPDQQKDLPWQAVNALCFLRYFMPAILYPHLHGLYSGLPDLRVQRTLTLIAKTLQSLANFNGHVQREEYMSGVRTFVEDSRQQMSDYVLAVSTPSETARTTERSEETGTRGPAMRALRQRRRAMPSLQREALPLPPYPIDVPRQLAIISAALARQVPPLPRSSTPDAGPLEKLCARFADVEREAFFRVSSMDTAALSMDSLSLAPSTEPRQSNTWDHYHVGWSTVATASGPTQRRTLRRAGTMREQRPTTAPGPAHERSGSSVSSTNSSVRPPVPSGLVIATHDLSVGRSLSLNRLRSSHSRSHSVGSLSGFASGESVFSSTLSVPLESPRTVVDETYKAKRSFLHGWGWK